MRLWSFRHLQRVWQVRQEMLTDPGNLFRLWFGGVHNFLHTCTSTHAFVSRFQGDCVLFLHSNTMYISILPCTFQGDLVHTPYIVHFRVTLYTHHILYISGWPCTLASHCTFQGDLVHVPYIVHFRVTLYMCLTLYISGWPCTCALHCTFQGDLVHVPYIVHFRVTLYTCRTLYISGWPCARPLPATPPARGDVQVPLDGTDPVTQHSDTGLHSNSYL